MININVSELAGFAELPLMISVGRACGHWVAHVYVCACF
jgi:hypothetical protein